MTYAVRMATDAMGEAKLQEVLDFHKKMKAGLTEDGDEMDTMQQLWSLWSAPFKPNLLNTVVFLVETAQMIAVLLVNYKGRPWMKGILENHPLFLSLFLCVAGVAGCAWGIVPQFNSLIHLDEFPSDEFRWTVMALVGISLVGTFLWDRIVTAIFAPVIFKAMLDEARATTLKDCFPAFKTAGKIALGLFVFTSGNPIVWIGAFMWWRRSRNAAAKKQEEESAARLAKLEAENPTLSKDSDTTAPRPTASGPGTGVAQQAPQVAGRKLQPRRKP
jgi:cation-transporting ATPase 13A1